MSARIVCATNFRLTKNEHAFTLACEPGQFYNSLSNKCENCTINSYQELKGQKQCIPCQYGAITITVGSKNTNDCIPGEF